MKNIFVNTSISLFFTLAIILTGGCVSMGEPSGGVVVKKGDTRVAIFTDDDRRLIHDYYHGNKRKKMPPGLAKKKRLPPGLRKQLHRKGTLPPGLQGRGLPHELESRLSHLHGDFVRLIVGTDLVLMNRRTRVIVDIIKDL